MEVDNDITIDTWIYHLTYTKDYGFGINDFGTKRI